MGTWNNGVLVNGYTIASPKPVPPCRHNNRKGMSRREGSYKVMDTWCPDCDWKDSKVFYDPTDF
jgi:hypothetical protein